jgi:hypothetical protein
VIKLVYHSLWACQSKNLEPGNIILFIRRLEDYLGAQGTHFSVPIPTWNPATPILVELRARINNPNPNLPLSSWATMPGGSARDPVFNYTSLMQFIG